MDISKVRPTLASAYAKAVLHKQLLGKYNLKLGKDKASLPHLAWSDPDQDASGTVPSGPICIIGAGAAGLMTALCLQYLGFTDITIYEANNRVGGRIFTCPLDTSGDPHNYYDVGAMRIPQIDTMASTMNMIQNTDIGLESPDGKPLSSKLADYTYHLSDNREPVMYYWQSTTPTNLSEADTAFKAAVATIANDFTQAGNFDNAFQKWIMSDNPQDSIDYYSTRMWLQTKQSPAWTYDKIEAAETMETSTGLFDQAFSETIIDYCDFEATTEQGKAWKRLDGGMGLLTDAMATKAKGVAGTKIIQNAPVTAMSTNSDNSISVTYTDPATGKSVSQSYATVFSTTALPCLERMDTSELGLDDDTLTAIRSLSYDRASKVAIKFNTNWWLKLLNNEQGGVSTSDLPISNVVYPSWNDEGANTVLMVSYAWAQDATRLGALIPDYSNPPVNSSGPPITPQKTDPIVTLCLQNLAKLFASKGGPSYDDLLSMYVSHHAWAWSHDPYTGGAFALFGPGQFLKYYPSFFEMKCNGRFGLAGEATSAHHAWISGALDSAYTTVLTWLNYWNDSRATNLKDSPYGLGQGRHPLEVDENLVHWAARLSEGGNEVAGSKLETQPK